MASFLQTLKNVGSKAKAKLKDLVTVDASEKDPSIIERAGTGLASWLKGQKEQGRVQGEKDVQRAKTIGKFLAGAAQSIPRSILSTTLTLGEKLPGKAGRSIRGIGEIRPEEDFGTLGAKLLGREPIKTIPLMGQESLEGFGVGKEGSKKYGTLAGVALTAADLIPVGAGKKQAIEAFGKTAIKALAKEGSEKAILKVLKQVGVMEAEQVAKQLAKEGTEKGVTSILKKAVVEAPKLKSFKIAGKGAKDVKNSARLLKPEDDAYVGMAKELGIESKGISDGTYEWFQRWQSPEMESAAIKKPAQEIIDEFSAFRPKKPVKLYRGISGKTDGAGIVGYESWTKDPEVARNFAGKNGRVVSRTFNPDEILYDMDRLPKDMLDINGNIEREVVVKASKAKAAATDAVEGAAKKSPQIGQRQFAVRAGEAAPDMKKFLNPEYEVRKTDDLITAADDLIKTDRNAAVTLAKTGTGDDAVATASRLVDDAIERAKAIKDPLAKDKLYEEAADIANEAARNLTEHGRAVQAAAILGRQTPEGMVRFAARQIQRHNEAVEGSKTIGGMLKGGFRTARKKVPELTGEQAAKVAESMRFIRDIKDPIKKAEAFAKLDKKIKALVPSSLYDKIITVWKAGLLTGIKTTGLNVMSNIAHSVSEVVKDVPATIVDRIASLFTGKRTMAATLRGTTEGVAEGANKGWKYLKTGFDERDIASKLDYRQVSFGTSKLAQAVQKYEEAVFRLLGSEDQPFYYAAKARSLYSQAIARAKNAGLSGAKAKEFVENLVKNPPDDMIKYATLDAETAVFQNKTVLGTAAKAIQKIPGGEIIAPFGKTPSSVATQLINYSPVGIVKAVAEQVTRGKFDQRLFSQAMGRALTGTGALYLGGKMLDNDLISLSYPDSEKERKQWELEGRIPNSIKIGGKWRTVGALGPVGMAMVVGGHIKKALNETGSWTAGLATILPGVFSTVSEQSFLKGVNQALDAIQDPQRSFTGFASSLAGSIIPTIVADISRATDAFERRTAGPIERIKSRIPGVRKTLEPKVDTFGTKIKTPGFWTVMIDATRPGQPTAQPNDPVVKELRRLSDAGWLSTPTQLGPNAGYPSLTPNQNTYLWQLAGKYAKSDIQNLIGDRFYTGLDDEEKSKQIQNVVDKAKVEARARAVAQALRGLKESEKRAKLAAMKEDDLLTRQVYERYLSLTNQ